MTKNEYLQLAILMSKAINAGDWDSMTTSVSYGDALDNRISAPRMAACLLGWTTFHCTEEYMAWVDKTGINVDERNRRVA